MLTATLNSARAHAQSERHARDVITLLDRISIHLQEAASGLITMIEPDSTSQAAGKKVFFEHLKALKFGLDEIRNETRGDIDEHADIAQLIRITQSGMQLMDETRRYIDEHGMFSAGVFRYKMLLADRSRQYADVSAHIIDRYREIQLAGEHAQDQTRMVLDRSLLIGLIANILMAGGLAWYFGKDIVNRLRIVQGNSLRFALGQQLTSELGGSDEIAKVDSAFHKMAHAVATAAQRERAIVENAVDVICSIDSDMRITQVNPAVRDWGYERDELIGQRLISIVDPEHADETVKALAVARDKAQVLQFDNVLKRKDGTPIAIRWSGAWSPENDAWICVAHDVTEQKKLEQLKRDFVAMISHDLRTPLTSFQCFVEGVGLGLYDKNLEEAKRRARNTASDVSRLIDMVTSLLDIEKMESGKMTVEISTFPVAALNERAIECVRQLAERKNVKIESEVCDVFLRADQDQLVQVLVNLLANAVKFSPENSRVKLAMEDKEDYVEFSVSDDGPGIPDEYRDRVFDRFEQVQLSDARVRGGSGLGLAICKAIVTAHDGEIGVVTQLGSGSRFWFRIPHKPEHALVQA